MERTDRPGGPAGLFFLRLGPPEEEGVIAGRLGLLRLDAEGHETRLSARRSPSEESGLAVQTRRKKPSVWGLGKRGA